MFFHIKEQPRNLYTYEMREILGRKDGEITVFIQYLFQGEQSRKLSCKIRALRT
nr:manganese catalase family protein [Bacillus wudalianchiensis]